METTLFLLLGMCVGVDAFDQPKYIWLLNKKTFGYEAKHGQDATHPRLSQCFQVNNHGNTHLTESSALEFDGSAHSYVDVLLNSSDSFRSFVFSYYIKPTAYKPRSVLVHYKADNPNNHSTISEFVLEGINKDYVVTLVYGDGTTTTILNEGDIRLNSLHLVSVWYRHQKSRLEVYFDFGHTHTIAAKQMTLNIPGRLRFGYHQSIPDSGYVGEISCATMYNSETQLINPHQVADVCNQAYPIPDTVPSCFQSPETALLVWPLDDQTYGYEIITGTAPSPPAEHRRFISGPADFYNKAVRFDGSSVSSLQTHFSYHILQRDFSFVMFIYLDEYSNGMIFHAKGSLDSPGINEIVLLVYENSISVYVYDATNIQPCGNLTVENKSLHLKWNTLAVQRSSSNIRILIAGELYGTRDFCNLHSTYWNGNQDVSLVFGGDSLEDAGIENKRRVVKEGFKGGLRCVIIFDIVHEAREILEALGSNCKSPDIPINIYEPVFASKPDERNTKHTLVQCQAAPDRQLVSIGNYPDISLITCGLICLSEQYCRSYSYSTNHVCILYDCVVISQLVTATNTNYYAVQYVDLKRTPSDD